MADSCPTHDSTFLPKQDATSRVAAIIEEFQKGYAEEAELVVGVLEGVRIVTVMLSSVIDSDWSSLTVIVSFNTSLSLLC